MVDEGLAALQPGAAAALLVELGVPEPDRDEVLATLPSPATSPERFSEVASSVSRLAAALGRPEHPHHFPDAVGHAPLERRCFPVHVFLAMLPLTRAWFAARGVPSDVVAESAGDLARHMELHRRTWGTTGVDAAWWLTLFLRGEIVEVGRLQFNWFRLGQSDESPLWYPPEAPESSRPGFRTGDVCLGVHIPESGPLSPAACDESFARAAELFARSPLWDDGLPGAQPLVATCMSWLLDDELANWLPAESNIVAFQRRFELVPGGFEADNEPLSFVFRRPPAELADLDSLRQATTLERAIVAHLRAGGHWRMRTGWLRLL